jgi:hypothetical protein
MPVSERGAENFSLNRVLGIRVFGSSVVTRYS